MVVRQKEQVREIQVSFISIDGQESTCTTWRLAKVNPAIRGLDAQIGDGSTFRNDRHPDLKADYVLTNPPFLLGVRP